MTQIQHIGQSGIYPNDTTQCSEAWVVNPETGEKVLLSTCSMCVSEEQYQWWIQEVWGRLMNTRTLEAA